MLIEIKCDAFKTGSQEIRPAIQFHKGLNVVLGGDKADNSIGKSTFLLIVDYAFGGIEYPKSSTAKEVGKHTIFFTFQFGHEILSFGRNTIDTTNIMVCNRDYQKTGQMTLKEFTTLLTEKYGLPKNNIHFRSMVGRFSRAYGKDNCHVNKPLQYADKDKEKNGIFALENLFEEYDTVAEYQKQVSTKQTEVKFFNTAHKKDNIYSIRGKKAYRNAFNTRTELLKQKKLLETEMDLTTSNQQTKNAYTAGIYRYNIKQRRQEISEIQTRLKVLDQSINSEFLEAQRNIDKLKSFFPTIELEHLTKIENFHQKIRRIFQHELIAESDVLKTRLTELNFEIKDLQRKIQALGEPLAISTEEFEKYGKLLFQIYTLNLQIERYKQLLNLKEELDVARKNYAEIQTKALLLIQGKINKQNSIYTELISKDAAYPPVITFTPPDKYTYISPKDNGTGTAYREIIIFDLTIFKLTKLPILIHDSFMFKNIEDEYIEQTLNLYSNSPKQIFIAFDGATKYSPQVQSILSQNTVLKLSKGNELFGKSWARKS